MSCVSSTEAFASTWCVKNNLERDAEGFGSFVQNRLHPLSGVTWLGCDAAMPGGTPRLNVGLMRCQARDLMMPDW